MKPEVFLYRFFTALFIYIMSIGVILPRGSIATQISGIIFFIFTFYHFIKVSKPTKQFDLIIFFLVYLSILVVFSSNFLYSLSNLAATAIWIMILPISFLSIDSLEKFKKLINSIALIAIFYIFNILLSTFLGIKGKSYSGEIFDVGNVFTEGLNSMAYLLVASPLIIHLNPRYRRLIILIAVIIFVLVFVQLKRISIIAILIGFIVNLIYSGSRVNILFGLIISGLMILVAYPLFENTLDKQIKVRQRRLSTQNYEEEGRYQESLAVFDEIVLSSNPKLFFFGKEVFNSPGNYANGRYGKRMIHNDYNAILHGSGIVGLILFILWPVPLFLLYRKIKTIAKYEFEDKKLFDFIATTFISFLVIGYVLSISGGINAILFNAVRVAVIGSSLRILYEYYIKFKKKNS
jgi:hypothetical protein